MFSLLALLTTAVAPDPAGTWRAVLDLAGGELRFTVTVGREGAALAGRLCNATACTPFSSVSQAGDSLVLELGDYAAAITAAWRGDSLVGEYRNVGRRGPRAIPFRAARGRWPRGVMPPSLAGRWDAWFLGGFEATPRVIEFGEGSLGLEGTVISNSGDYGLFSGEAAGDSVRLSHFDGSYVYLLTARLSGDTLRGTFHAGLRSQTPFVATRSSGQPHLLPPTAITTADTTQPLVWRFPGLEGDSLGGLDPRFRGKVVLLDIFGTWCPTCHDAAPVLVDLDRAYRDRGLEIVGVAFETTGDPRQDAPLVRRYREKFGIEFPLLYGGSSEPETIEAALPQLRGFTAFPTTLFLGRDGRIRRIHAGFYGPAAGARHEALVREIRREVERLLAE